jgi:hypothetical protein
MSAMSRMSEKEKDERGEEKEKQLLACTIANLFDCSRGRFVVPWRWQLSRDDTALTRAMKVKCFVPKRKLAISRVTSTASVTRSDRYLKKTPHKVQQQHA